MLNLYQMSVDFAPHMPIEYHLEFVRIAKDILRIRSQKEKAAGQAASF